VFKAAIFLKRVKFEDAQAELFVGNDTGDAATIKFRFVRTLMVFKESDFFAEIARYQHEKIIDGGERTLGVFRISKSAILQDVLGGRLDKEQPMHFWLSTPDECVEIVGFEPPTISVHTGSVPTSALGE
jgi:hypothetical protein